MASLPPGKQGGKEQSGLRYPTNGKTIYQRPLNRTKTSELSQASFAYLFSEMVGYAQRRVTGIQDLEKRYVANFTPTSARAGSRAICSRPPSANPSRCFHSQLPASKLTTTVKPTSRLNVQGHPIGLKLLDLLLFREPARSQTRPLTIITLLHFIKINVWQHLFGRQADRLEKSSNPDTPDEYMIIDNEPLVNAYISVPREMSQLNCAAFVAGVVEGSATARDFRPG